MKKIFFLLLTFVLRTDIAAFELQRINAPQIAEAAAETLPPSAPLYAEKLAPKAVSYAAYSVNGVEVIIPHIDGGRNVLAVLRPGAGLEPLSAQLRSAFNAAAGARAAAIQPQSKAELELAAKNPGATIVSLNQLLPAAVAALFNREAGFAGPNCFNAAFVAAGMMSADKLRHVGNPETDQRLAMYFKKVPAGKPQPGDILVFNDGDHGVFYLGGGLIFQKKSYLKQHIYRIVAAGSPYKPEPNEWHPGPFDGPDPFSRDTAITETAAWRATGAQYQFGPATAAEQAKAEVVIFIAENMEEQAHQWHLSRELGYFTEVLLEGLVSDWSAMANSRNPVLKAYYHQLGSLRDQANQSIESEILSSQNAQAHASELLKEAWLPRNAYSRGLIGQLLKIYGRNPDETEKVMDAIDKDFDKNPLPHVKNGGQ